MKKLLLSSIFLILSTSLFACTNTPSSPQTPEPGTDQWIQWVENQVHITDSQGHGPDLGSDEWCYAVERRLLNSQSGLPPCSMEWAQQVTQTLLNP